MRNVFAALAVACVFAFTGCTATNGHHGHDHGAKASCCGTCGGDAKASCCGKCGGDKAKKKACKAGCTKTCCTDKAKKITGTVE